jgi:hypothetical protein
MATIAEIRLQYPQYQDMPDKALADALYTKFYSDLPRADFDTKVGLTAERANVGAESDVPLLADEMRRLQAQRGQPRTADQAKIESKGLFSRVNDEILGAFEVPSTILTGAAGAIAGPAAGVFETIKSGKYGTPEGVKIGEKRAKEVMKSMTYQPQTAEGRRNLEALGEVLGSEALRPLQGAIGLPVTSVPVQSVRPALQYGKNIIGEEAALAAQPIVKALETRAAGKTAERAAESFQRAPQIDAAKDAARLGILLDPAISNPTIGNKLREFGVDPVEIHNKFSQQNKTKWVSIAKKEMGLPESVSLTSSKPFEQARAQAAKPYENIRNIQTLAPNPEVIAKIDSLYDTGLIGGKASENAIRALTQDAIEKISSGMTGQKVLDSLSDLRKKATKTYNSNAATPEMVDVADVRMAIANALEDLIEANVSRPEELTAFRKARQDMARAYTYEAATDISTGLVDPQKLKRMLDKGVPLSGDAEAMARIAGNYPEITSLTPIKREGIQRFTRSGTLGTAGAVMGSVAGFPGAIAGGALGAGAGILGSKLAAKRMSSPEYQAANAVPQDFRPPVNMLRPAPPSTTQNLPVPFDMRNALVEPGYTPNFVPAGPRPEFSLEGQLPQLPPPSAASTLAGVESRRAYDLAAARAAAQQAEAAAAAQAAQGRAPTSGGVALDLDPVTGQLREVSRGMKGATPETFQNYGTSLNSASNKIAAGKAFDLTAEERIAFNKTKVDLAVVEPGYAKLSDKQITERMMDRQQVDSLIQKARQQAIAFEQIAARAESEQAKFNAMAQRQRMMDLAESLEEKLSLSRPDTSRKTQGPKTREAKRNALAEDIEVKNKLAR